MTTNQDAPFTERDILQFLLSVMQEPRKRVTVAWAGFCAVERGGHCAAGVGWAQTVFRPVNGSHALWRSIKVVEFAPRGVVSVIEEWKCGYRRFPE